MRCAMLLYTTLKTIEALPGAHGAGVWRLVVHKIVERPEVKCGIGSKRRQLGVDAFDLGAGVFDQEGGKLGVDTQQVVSNYQPLGSMLQLLLRVWDLPSSAKGPGECHRQTTPTTGEVCRECELSYLLSRDKRRKSCAE